MVKNTPISKQERKRQDFALLLRCKVDRKKIRRELNISEDTIIRVKKAMSHRRSVSRRKGSKAPKKLIQTHKTRIYHLLSQNPFLSCTDIQSRLDLPVSAECVRLHLIKSGFCRRRPEPKLALTENTNRLD